MKKTYLNLSDVFYSNDKVSNEIKSMFNFENKTEEEFLEAIEEHYLITYPNKWIGITDKRDGERYFFARWIECSFGGKEAVLYSSDLDESEGIEDIIEQIPDFLDREEDREGSCIYYRETRQGIEEFALPKFFDSTFEKSLNRL